jgi:hypothetical protein
MRIAVGHGRNGRYRVMRNAFSPPRQRRGDFLPPSRSSNVLPHVGENLGFVVMTSVAIRFYVYTPKRAVDAPDKKYLIYFL